MVACNDCRNHNGCEFATSLTPELVKKRGEAGGASMPAGAAEVAGPRSDPWIASARQKA
jgi:hypothetical protein